MSDTQFILVAEDDSDDVYLLRWALKQAGLNHEIIHLCDGAATIDYLKGTPPFDDRAHYPMPRLLLLDLKMPKVNGLNVLAWLAARPDLCRLPAVVLSSSVFEAEAEAARKLGAREFLTKPNDLDDLVRLVQRLHDRWLVEALVQVPVFDDLAHSQTRSLTPP